MTRLPFPQRQRGFAYIAAVVFLVVVAGIAVALLRLTETQQTTINSAVLAARANLAARGGIEWVFHNPAQRCTSTNLTDFRNDSGFRVSINCAIREFKEGETDAANPQPVLKNIYRIEAIACNGATTNACPDADSVARQDYVERKQVATICLTKDGAPCY